MSALIGALASSSAWPMVDILMVRGVRPASRSGRSSARSSIVEIAAGGQQQAAGGIAKCAHERGQAGDIARRHAAAARALHAVIRADQRRPGGAVQLRERFDFAGG